MQSQSQSPIKHTLIGKKITESSSSSSKYTSSSKPTPSSQYQLQHPQDQPATTNIQYQIVILNHALSQNLHTTTFLGIVNPTQTLVSISKIYNPQPNSIHSIHKFRTRYLASLNNLYKASTISNTGEHSNIVNVMPIACFNKNNSHAYMVMEYCEGGDLGVEIRNRRVNGQWWNLGELYQIIKQIVNGYGQLYRCGIVHQNIHPGSVYISNGYLKIGNFNLSQNISSSKVKDAPQLTVSSGSPYFTAPQKHNQNYIVSPQSDIFSLGVLFYLLLFDQHPYCQSYSNINLDNGGGIDSNIFNSKFLGNVNESLLRVQSKLSSRLNSKQKLNQLDNTDTSGNASKKQKNNLLMDYKRNIKIMQQIKINQMNTQHEALISCKSKQQQQIYQKLINLIKRMLQKQPQKRIKFPQIILTLQQFPVYLNSPSSPLSFLSSSTQYLPQTLKYTIEAQTVISQNKINYRQQNQEYKKIREQFPELWSIRGESQRINRFSLVIQGIVKGIEKYNNSNINTNNYIRQNKNEINKIKQWLIVINYCITKLKYLQILQQISQLNKQQLKQFYRTDLHYLLNNTNQNQQYLQQQYLSLLSGQQRYGCGQFQNSHQKCYEINQQAILHLSMPMSLPFKLAEISIEQIFQIFKQFLMKTIKQNNNDRTLDQQNCGQYLLISIIIVFVNKIEYNFTIEDLEQLKLKQMEIYTNYLDQIKDAWGNVLCTSRSIIRLLRQNINKR